MADNDKSKRQVAYKVSVADVLNNRYVKEEGWLPNYIAVRDKKVSRANILGVIVSKDSPADGSSASQNFILDDGTGRIPLRFFEAGSNAEVGDIVVVVGRPREFGTERYVVPEIVKKIVDPGWVQVRKMELAADKHKSVALNAPAETPEPDALAVETEDFVDEANPLSKIVNIIKDMDDGEGVGVDDITVKMSGVDAESFIKKLLEQGDIFEVKPGRFKVLE